MLSGYIQLKKHVEKRRYWKKKCFFQYRDVKQKEIIVKYKSANCFAEDVIITFPSSRKSIYNPLSVIFA